jgi:hypothetical protein
MPEYKEWDFDEEPELTVVMRPMWEKCDCEDYWCHLHGMHAHECCCPDVDTFIADLGDMPYDIMVPVVYEKNDPFLLEEQGAAVQH